MLRTCALYQSFVTFKNLKFENSIWLNWRARVKNELLALPRSSNAPTIVELEGETDPLEVT